MPNNVHLGRIYVVILQTQNPALWAGDLQTKLFTLTRLAERGRIYGSAGCHQNHEPF
jgi:hypothetical protein